MEVFTIRLIFIVAALLLIGSLIFVFLKIKKGRLAWIGWIFYTIAAALGTVLSFPMHYKLDWTLGFRFLIFLLGVYQLSQLIKAYKRSKK